VKWQYRSKCWRKTTDFKQLKDLFAENRIEYEKKITKREEKKTFRVPIGLRRTIENLAVFAVSVFLAERRFRRKDLS